LLIYIEESIFLLEINVFTMQKEIQTTKAIN
jgi:hypothetical protein